MSFSKENLKDLINVAITNKASDVHIRTDETPSLRINKDLIPVKSSVFLKEDIVDLINIITKDKMDATKNNIVHQLEEFHEEDGGYEIPDLCRLRYNIFKYSGKLGVVFRIIKTKVPSFEELRLVPIIKKIAEQKRGLILVTGATGHGKSTTLATMINHINNNFNKHIVSIEDPIEYVHPQIKSRISQREVGIDTISFTDGLKSALRQDPDVILIGEMRDSETISTALKAAETGHLVLSTMHTTNAMTTIGRIISMFPSEQQQEVRKRLSIALNATIGQRLIPTLDKKNLIPAIEIMISTPGIKEAIRGEEPMEKIPVIIEDSYSKDGSGGQSFDQHLWELFKNGLISKDTATKEASSTSNFLQKMLVN